MLFYRPVVGYCGNRIPRHRSRNVQRSSFLLEFVPRHCVTPEQPPPAGRRASTLNKFPCLQLQSSRTSLAWSCTTTLNLKFDFNGIRWPPPWWKSSSWGWGLWRLYQVGPKWVACSVYFIFAGRALNCHSWPLLILCGWVGVVVVVGGCSAWK